MGTTTFLYSKRNSIVTIIVMLVLGVLFTSNINKAYNNHDKPDLIVFAGLFILLAFVLVIVVVKRLLPALRKEVILEFNETVLIDYLRNITVNWNDIELIDFRRTRSSSMIILNLKWESDYGKYITVSLRWVEGKDNEIYSTALTYLNRFTNGGIA
jgi:tryptophan-rich sensory protein